MATPNVRTPQHSSESQTGYGEVLHSAVQYTMDSLKIGFAAATAFVMTACNGNVEQKPQEANIEHVKPGNHHDEQHPPIKRLSPAVIAKLKQNEEALAQMDTVGVQNYYDALHAKNPLAVEEKSAVKLRMRCVDDRQAGNGEVFTESEGHGIAGVGILATDDELKAIARDAVGIAFGKSKERGKIVEIIVEPHLGENCGAAKASWMRKKENEKSKSKTPIDDEAMGGAHRTKAALDREITNAGAEKHVRAVVQPFNQEHFLDIADHPAAVVDVNFVKGTVAVASLPEGHLSYKVSGNIGDKALFDAILSAFIAKKSHGMHAGVKGLPKNTLLRVIPWVTDTNHAEQKKKEIEAGLRAHGDLRGEFNDGKIRVEPWIMPSKK